MVGSINSVVTGNVYLNAGDNTDIVLTETTQNVKDTQVYQTLVKLVSDGYKGVGGTKEDKAAVRNEAQQLLSQLHSGLGGSDTSIGNVITVSMPKASSLLTLLIAMIESENESSIAGYKMSGELGVISQDFTNAAADELREQGILALSSGITSGTTQMVASGVGSGTGFLKIRRTLLLSAKGLWDWDEVFLRQNKARLVWRRKILKPSRHLCRQVAK